MQGHVIIPTFSGKVDATIYAKIKGKYANVVVVTPIVSLAKKSPYPLAVTPDRLAQLRVPIDALVIEHGECGLLWGEFLSRAELSFANIFVFCAHLPNYRLVADLLGLQSFSVAASFIDRSQVKYVVRPKRAAMKQLAQEVGELEGGGVVFCVTKKEVEEVGGLLESIGESVIWYHGDLAKTEKDRRLNEWTNGTYRVLVTTTATAWLDKSDVRFVIQTTIGKSLEQFFLLSSLAGRDGLPATSILYFDFADKAHYEILSPQQESCASLLAMTAFGHYAHRCKRVFLAEYFASSSCVTQSDCIRQDSQRQQQCSSCSADVKYTAVNRSTEMMEIFRLCESGNRVNLKPFTLATLRDAAMGSKSSASASLPGFACLKDKFTAVGALEFLRHLVIQGILGERTVPLLHGYGGYVTYVQVKISAVEAAARSASLEHFEVPKKRKLRETLADRLVSQFGLDEDVAVLVQVMMPASVGELRMIGHFENAEEIVDMVDVNRPPFKYAAVFAEIF